MGLDGKVANIDSGPPEAVLEAARSGATPIAEDRLQRLRDAARAAKDLEARRGELEDELKRVNIALYTALTKDLPDLFDEIGIDSISVAAEGNLPAFEAKATPFYAANIAASWTEEKRDEAFRYLERIHSGDLIKTTVTIDFKREDHDRARFFVDEMKKRGMFPTIKETVHNQTLTAWLKEMVERRKVLPDLDKIGGTVGRIIKLKDKDNG